MDSLEREVGELKAKVDGLCAAFVDFRAEVRDWQKQIHQMFSGRLDQHSRRLRALEQWRSWLAGGLAMLGILWAAVWTWMKR